MKNIIQSWWITPLFVLCLVALFFSFNNRYHDYKRINLEVANAQLRLDVLKKEQIIIENDVINGQPEHYLEELAKAKLNYKKPGEKVVLVYTRGEAVGQSENPTITEEVIANHRDRLELWWEYLIGR